MSNSKVKQSIPIPDSAREKSARTKIFISHANPEDNYRAAWLAGKLMLLGYDVWLELNAIKPGQYFNRNYAEVIKKDSIRFLSLVTTDYLRKANIDDSGVMNELLCARAVKDIDGFIIPMLFDQTPPEELPVGMVGRNSIFFNNNWGRGLKQLLDYFAEESIPKSETTDPLPYWFDAQNISSEPIEIEERYYSNWFETYLPQKVYCHKSQFASNTELNSTRPTFIRDASWIITFASSVLLEKFLIIEESKEFDVKDVIASDQFEIDDKTTLVDAKRKLVKLVNATFKNYMRSRGLLKYEQSNRRDVHYFPNNELNRKPIMLKKFDRTRRSIVGRTLEFDWSFGISVKYSFSPISYFQISYHLIFTDRQGKLVESDLQHQLRRSTPNGWYNREWFEKLLAFMYKVSGYDGYNLIRIPFGEDSALTINVLPLQMDAGVGYKEPNDEQ